MYVYVYKVSVKSVPTPHISERVLQIHVPVSRPYCDHDKMTKPSAYFEGNLQSINRADRRLRRSANDLVKRRVIVIIHARVRFCSLKANKKVVHEGPIQRTELPTNNNYEKNETKNVCREFCYYKKCIHFC